MRNMKNMYKKFIGIAFLVLCATKSAYHETDTEKVFSFPNFVQEVFTAQVTEQSFAKLAPNAIAPQEELINLLKKTIDLFKKELEKQKLNNKDLQKEITFTAPDGSTSITQTPSYIQKITSSQKTTKNIIIGDIHGGLSFFAALINLIVNGDVTTDLKIANPDTYIYLLGDIADRGGYGVENWLIILMLKSLNWNNVFICRGNHEEVNVAQSYGFENEVDHKYPEKKDVNTIFELFKTLWNLLPSALVVGDQLFLCHGGLPCYPKKDADNVNNISPSLLKAIKALNTSPFQMISEMDAYALRWTDCNGKKKKESVSRRKTGLYECSKNMIDLFTKETKLITIRGHQHYALFMNTLSDYKLYNNDDKKELNEKYANASLSINLDAKEFLGFVTTSNYSGVTGSIAYLVATLEKAESVSTEAKKETIRTKTTIQLVSAPMDKISPYFSIELDSDTNKFFRIKMIPSTDIPKAIYSDALTNALYPKPVETKEPQKEKVKKKITKIKQKLVEIKTKKELKEEKAKKKIEEVEDLSASIYEKPSPEAVEDLSASVHEAYPPKKPTIIKDYFATPEKEPEEEFEEIKKEEEEKPKKEVESSWSWKSLKKRITG